MAIDTLTTSTTTTITKKHFENDDDDDDDDIVNINYNNNNNNDDEYEVNKELINNDNDNKKKLLINQNINQKNDDNKFKLSDIVWRNVILLTILHILAFYGWITFIIDPMVKWQTSVASLLFGLFSSTFGVTAGAHRLWSHRSYKAKWPLRLILAIANTMALQNDIYEWSRDHRVHHKYSETDADPHNSKRGFFFAHMGWLMLKKHPDVKLKGQSIDLSDLWADPVVRFQRRFYIPLVILCWGLIPTLVPYYFWNETLWFSFLGCVCIRYVYVLHCTWLVNSAAHMWGNRPYDKNIEPRESNSVIYLSLGEGYHNYHHTFPYDYSASELGFNYNFNLTTFLIDFFEYIGWTYDLKKPSDKIIMTRKYRTGDGTINNNINNNYYKYKINDDKNKNKKNNIIDWIIGLNIVTAQLTITLLIRNIYQRFFL